MCLSGYPHRIFSPPSLYCHLPCLTRLPPLPRLTPCLFSLPIVMLGGEGPMATHYVTGHFYINEMAKHFGGLILSLEHRFYGESMPTADSSTANLRYLSSEQALADAAWFAQNIGSTFGLNGDEKFIVVGGSYSGNLAGWARLKYPNVFHGASASSAPVLAELDFYQYYDVVGRSLGSTCAANFKAATAQVQQLLQHQTGQNKLQEIFNTCIPPRDQWDIQQFWSQLTNGPAGVVQYANDNVNYQPFNIETMCEYLSPTGGSIPLLGLANLTNSVFGKISWPGKCMPINYTEAVQEMQPTSAGRSWFYQTCREFGYYQTGDGSTSSNPFTNTLSLEYFVKQCQDVFGEPFTPNTKWTNVNYGALDIETSNTFFPNGNVDPWHALGVSGQTVGVGPVYGPSTYSVLINGTAHCADMYPPLATDAPGLTAARNTLMGYLTTWLSPQQ
jgi:pimeloyl-ACP methyl ester carboxylesterase